MADLSKVIKVTQEQYDKLSRGEPVGPESGLQDGVMYLVEDNNYNENEEYHITGNSRIPNENGGPYHFEKQLMDVPEEMKQDILEVTGLGAFGSLHDHLYYSSSSGMQKEYVNNKWVNKLGNGLSNFEGQEVFFVEERIVVFHGINQCYILNEETSTGNECSILGGNITPFNIGAYNCIYSPLSKATYCWNNGTCYEILDDYPNIDISETNYFKKGNFNIDARNIVSDDNNLYCILSHDIALTTGYTSTFSTYEGVPIGFPPCRTSPETMAYSYSFDTLIGSGDGAIFGGYNNYTYYLLGDSLYPLLLDGESPSTDEVCLVGGHCIYRTSDDIFYEIKKSSNGYILPYSYFNENMFSYPSLKQSYGNYTTNNIDGDLHTTAVYILSKKPIFMGDILVKYNGSDFSYNSGNLIIYQRYNYANITGEYPSKLELEVKLTYDPTGVLIGFKTVVTDDR